MTTYNGIMQRPYAQPVKAVGQNTWDVSFADSGTSVLSDSFTPPIVGTDVTYNQASSALNIVTGVNVNAEFLTRSTVAWSGSMRLKFLVTASARIANNNFAVLLADLIGENLPVTVNSDTSVTVALPEHPYTALSVGQFMLLGGIVGVAGVPGRYAIASVVPKTSITFTVSGWPASGTGTLTLFGHNYVRNLFTGTTATNVAFNAQRSGWASGDTTATINSTASPGTVIHNELSGREIFLMDQSPTPTGSPTVSSRTSRNQNVPMEDVKLCLWLWSYNGTVAPAASTTFTVGFVSVEDFINFPVYLQGARAQGGINPVPMTISGAPAISGQTAEDSVATGNPVRVGALAYDTLPPFTIVNGDAVSLRASRSGQLVVKENAAADLDFRVNTAVTTNTQTALRAAQATNVRQNVTTIVFQNTGATATTLTIQDGSTTLVAINCPANQANPHQLNFITPLRGTAATALNYTAGTTGANVLLTVTGFNSY